MSTTEAHASPSGELAPSDVRADEPLLARLIGLAGLGATTLGVVAVIANEFTPRMISSGWGLIIAACGVVGLLVHALWDSEVEYRRLYGLIGASLTLISLVSLVIPGRAEAASSLVVGFYFFPFGAPCLIIGLGLLAAFTKHETDPRYREWGEVLLLGTGLILALAGVALGVLWPTKMPNYGSVSALIGLAFLGVYLSRVDVSLGRGYQVAVGLGILGAAAFVYALVRTVAPTVLYDGPAVLKKPNQDLDTVQVLGRAALILASLGLVAAARLPRLAVPTRLACASVGLLFTLVFTLGCFQTSLVTEPPRPYLIPTGILLGFAGLLYLLASIAVVSDAGLVVLTKREFTSYLYSPIGYIVLIGVTLVSAIGYWNFLDDLIPDRERLIMLQRAGGSQAIEEPILVRYPAATLIAAFQALILVPALTMRSFSEEKRTGTLEVLLTAPVSEWVVVLSKFLAAWAFFLLSWVPMGLYLVALWVTGGQPFEYRPIVSYYVAVAVFGAAFVAMGIFFSSLTKNQIVAAVLTFAVLIGMLFTVWLRSSKTTMMGPGLRAVLEQFDFYSTWTGALGGSFAVKTIVLQLSMAVFWLFVTTKVLESRKWG